MTQTPAITPVDLYDPLMMMPEQRLVDAICALTNGYLARSASVDSLDSVHHLLLSDRIAAFVDLVDQLGMSDELQCLLLRSSNAALFGDPVAPISFSLLASDEDTSND